MIDTARKVFQLLSPKERRRALLLLVMMIIMAFIEVLGVASIMPFMAVLANPDVVDSNKHLGTLYQGLGFSDTSDFLYFLGLLVFGILVASTAFKVLTTWAITRFTQMRGYAMAQRLTSHYLRQPYEWYLGRHSADLGRKILQEVQLVVSGSIMPLLEFFAKAVLIVALVLLLIVVDPVLALAVGGGIGAAYGVTYLLLSRLLGRLGEERVANNQKRFKVLSDIFGGIKEVKMSGSEDLGLKKFGTPARRLADIRVRVSLIGVLPRYALEVIAFGGILAITLVLMRRSSGLDNALPIIALYAMTGYRLMPALQTAYNLATTLRFSTDALDKLCEDFSTFSDTPRTAPQNVSPLRPRKQIVLDNVSYTYPGASKPAIESVSLAIPAGSIVGFVGSTGAGKTTIVDIILGLLEPGKGDLLVDSTRIDETNRRQWQQALAYVPQTIFLTDGSVEENISYADPHRRLDRASIERAARMAGLHDFIIEELPLGYATPIGERGVRLSGGQRQRIGIARALYRSPSLLVLDEATSALDNLTEEDVMAAIRSLDNVTCLIVAHRLTTVKDCDKIFLLESGKVVENGTFAELTKASETFGKMARGL
jgi:ABC-type multidrug transport system fused ATPase/permease subunit